MSAPKPPLHAVDAPDATLKVPGGDNPVATGLPGYCRASLRVLVGKDQGRVFVLKAPLTILGRGPDDAEVCLDDERVSRGHAAITYHEHTREFRVADLKSANGTLLNGSRVTSYAIHDGDKILVGETVLVFELVIGPGA